MYYGSSFVEVFDIASSAGFQVFILYLFGGHVSACCNLEIGHSRLCNVLFFLYVLRGPLGCVLADSREFGAAYV